MSTSLRSLSGLHVWWWCLLSSAVLYFTWLRVHFFICWTMLCKIHECKIKIGFLMRSHAIWQWGQPSVFARQEGTATRNGKSDRHSELYLPSKNDFTFSVAKYAFVQRVFHFWRVCFVSRSVLLANHRGYIWSVCVVPTAPPQEVEFVAINSTTLRFTWNPPPQQFINGINQGYKVNKRTTVRFIFKKVIN